MTLLSSNPLELIGVEVWDWWVLSITLDCLMGTSWFTIYVFVRLPSNYRGGEANTADLTLSSIPFSLTIIRDPLIKHAVGTVTFEFICSNVV